MNVTDKALLLIEDINEVKKRTKLSTESVIKVFEIVSKREFTEAFKDAHVVGFNGTPSALEKIAMELSSLSGLFEISSSIDNVK